MRAKWRKKRVRRLKRKRRKVYIKIKLKNIKSIIFQMRARSK